MSVDPLADSPANISHSPYAYVWNNPINAIDPDGRHGESVNNEYEIVKNKDGTTTTNFTGTRGGEDRDYITFVDENGEVTSQVSTDVYKEYTSGTGNGHDQKDNPTPGYREVHGKTHTDIQAYEWLLTGGSGKTATTVLAAKAKSYSISQLKEALKEVYKELNMQHRIQELHDYHPFGKTMRSYSLDSEERYLFTGKERDSKIGYDYFGARYYDSDVGRFLSVDPLADQTPGWNPYHYTHNNPINMIDPDGRSAEHIIIGDNDDSDEILSNLQNLTNDKLAINPENRRVYVDKKGGANNGQNLAFGTKLVKDLMRDDNTVEIKKVSGGNGTTPLNENGKRLKNIVAGKEYDSVVGVSLIGSNTVNMDGTRGGVPAFVTLGHELGHARTLSNGTNDRSIGSMYDFDQSNFYNKFTAEELRGRINENIIRAEHNIKPRAIPIPNFFGLKRF